ncbi:unnamed protein product [Arabidopsis arenosa]|uniref:DUF295 domain-containing protein n=1 Tax=Arabidopsis arenosa TaxID=38785 RepID=A0A8S2A1E4_ARAAE|nr:unnamed protein product [Arabidopsis arenosa]
MANAISRWRRWLRAVQSRRRQDLQIGKRLLRDYVPCRLLDLGITMPGIEPNSIYFTRQDRVLHRQDINLHICVFNLETKTLKRLPRLSNMKLMDARWFLPGI